MTRAEFQKVYGRIVAKAWADDAFRQRLVSDPAAVLKENGIPVPEGTKVNVLESTSTEINLALPPRPDSADISVEDLEVREAALRPCWGTC